jgi:hypothetical protein
MHSAVLGTVKWLLASSVVAVVALSAPAAALADGVDLQGLSVPPADPALAFVAPTPDQANYPARLEVFVDATVPDDFQGQPVQFLTTYQNQGGADVLGLPTSLPRVDPNNPHFIYLRFENGVLFYNATEGSTQILGL